MVLVEEDDGCQHGACSIDLDEGGDDARSGDGNHNRVQGGQGAKFSEYTSYDEFHMTYDELRPCSQWQAVCCISSQLGELQDIGNWGSDKRNCNLGNELMERLQFGK
jgi:hypothetical protein